LQESRKRVDQSAVRTEVIQTLESFNDQAQSDNLSIDDLVAALEPFSSSVFFFPFFRSPEVELLSFFSARAKDYAAANDPINSLSTLQALAEPFVSFVTKSEILDTYSGLCAVFSMFLAL
jgi:hypothetical protein